MKRCACLAGRLVATLFAANASADVLYVSEWRSTEAADAPGLLTNVEFRGIVALETPTLREVGRWTDVPASSTVMISADARWLFLWNYATIQGVIDPRLHVVDVIPAVDRRSALLLALAIVVLALCAVGRKSA